VNQYREGKVKSTPNRGVKKTLKPYAYKRSEPFSGVTACLLHNEPTSCSCPARLSTGTYGAEAKASLNRAKLVGRGRRETLRSTHGQDEVPVIRNGGPNE
jgi:hypothetical protein